MSRRGALLLVLGALLACRQEAAPDATAADRAKAQAACKTESDLQPGEGERALTAFMAYCAGKECPSLKKVAGVCRYNGRKSPAHYHVYTTLSARGTQPRSRLCDDLRSSGAFGMVTPIHIYCAGKDKPCTECGGGPGGHR